MIDNREYPRRHTVDTKTVFSGQNFIPAGAHIYITAAADTYGRKNTPQKYAAILNHRILIYRFNWNIFVSNIEIWSMI